MATQDNYVKTAFRLPADLHSKLLVESTERGRSMNAEIIARLEASFAPIQSQTDSDLKYRIMLLESEVLARQADLVETAYLIERLGDQISQRTLDEYPAFGYIVERLKRFAQRFVMTPDEESRLAKDRRDKMAALMAEIESRAAAPDGRLLDKAAEDGQPEELIRLNMHPRRVVRPAKSKK